MRFSDDLQGEASRNQADEKEWNSYLSQRDGFLPPLHPADPTAQPTSDPVINGIIVGCASSGAVIVLLQGLFG
jgi:hypothetical protein